MLFANLDVSLLICVLHLLSHYPGQHCQVSSSRYVAHCSSMMLTWQILTERCLRAC